MKNYNKKPIPRTDFTRSNFTYEECLKIKELLINNLQGFIELCNELQLTNQSIEFLISHDFSISSYEVKDLPLINEINVDDFDLDDMEDIYTKEDFSDYPFLKTNFTTSRYAYISLVYMVIPVSHNFRIPLISPSRLS